MKNGIQRHPDLTPVKDDNFWRDFAPTFGQEVRDYDIDLEVGEEMTLPARFIWETLIDGAWRNGEPGLYMYDETNDMHSFDVEKHPEHRIEATNPCGEQPLEKTMRHVTWVTST